MTNLISLWLTQASMAMIDSTKATFKSDSTPAIVKYSPTAKYEKKLLIYVCFSEKGISKPYFVPSGVAVNQKVYLEECIKKKLIPFIAKHHSDGEYVFWPDLASAHYAK